MPIQQQGFGGVVSEVDGSIFRAQRVTARPIDYQTFGHYQFARVTGVMAAALAANAVLFSFRWGDASRLAVLQRLKVSFQPLALFTAGTVADFGMDAYVARSFTASHTGGAAITTSGNNLKARTSMATSLITDLRMATTAALAGGTLTADADAFANSVGDVQRVNPAAATEEQRVNDPTLVYRPDVASGDHPLVFAQNEGFVVRNRGVWPAAGTGLYTVECAWAEVSAY